MLVPGHRLKTFLLCLVIVSWRGWDRLFRADLWGEDGAVFLAEGFRVGASSLLRSYAGSFHTLQRLIALGAIEVFPLLWIPSVICVTYFVIFAWIMSAIVEDRYTWLIPSRAARVMTAVMFCMLPGLTEMMGNLSNLNWILFGWLSMVGLKDPSQPITRWDLCAALLVTVSIGTTILLLPLFLWRFALSIRRGQPLRQWIVGAALLAVLMLVGVVPLLFLESSHQPPRHPYGAIVWIYYEHVIQNGLFTPWLGDRLTIAIDQPSMHLVARAVAIALLPSAAFLAWRFRRDERSQALLLFIGGVSAWTVAAVVSRLNAFEYFQQTLVAGSFDMRYAYPMAFAATLFWMAVLHPSALIRSRRPSLALVFIVLNLSLAFHRFSIASYGAERRWETSAPTLERSMKEGCPVQVVVPQYPDPWTFVYYSPRPAVSCP
jgi:hypothetical protein